MLAYTMGSVAIILSKGGWLGSGFCSHLTTLPDSFLCYIFWLQLFHVLFCLGNCNDKGKGSRPYRSVPVRMNRNGCHVRHISYFPSFKLPVLHYSLGLQYLIMPLLHAG